LSYDTEPADADLGSDFDAAALLKRIGGKQEMMKDLLDIFTADIPVQFEVISQASVCRNFRQIERIAHRLKGSSGTICAGPLHDSFVRIEQAATAKDGAKLAALLQEARRRWDRFLAAVENIRRNADGNRLAGRERVNGF
jgi:HPt (histidine-containing phosphotransfer) domain-containing protein